MRITKLSSALPRTIYIYIFISHRSVVKSNIENTNKNTNKLNNRKLPKKKQ